MVKTFSLTPGTANCVRNHANEIPRQLQGRRLCTGQTTTIQCLPSTQSGRSTACIVVYGASIWIGFSGAETETMTRYRRGPAILSRTSCLIGPTALTIAAPAPFVLKDESGSNGPVPSGREANTSM